MKIIFSILLACSLTSHAQLFNSPAWIRSLKVAELRSLYSPPATDFNGSDNLNRGAGLTGVADGKVGTVSFWIKYQVNSEVVTPIFVGNYPVGGNPEEGVTIYRGAQTRIFIDGYNSAGTVILRRKTISGGSFEFTIANGWQHYMASWDLAAGICHVYINGIDAEDSESAITTNENIDLTQSDWAFGSYQDGTQRTDACVSQFYLNLAEYMDLSDFSTRQKLYNSGAVDYGADGSNPTGTAPIVFFNNPFGTFQNNLGTGGNFTVTGALTDCVDHPN